MTALLNHLNQMRLTNMPDISMCEGGLCPKKEQCYRYTAIPTGMQSFFLYPPFTTLKEGDEICEYYWDNKNEK